MNQSLKTNMNYLSMALTCHANTETVEKAMSELGSKQRRSDEAYFDREPTEDEKWNDRIQEIKAEGADKLIYHMVSDPYLELAIVYQMALDGIEACDIGQYVASKVKRMVEERAHPFLQKQSD